MDLTIRLTVLDQIYALYDDFIGQMDTACRRYCAACCTGNVILTTLEGYQIALYMTAQGRSDLFARIQAAAGQRRFQPTMTINTLADLCSRGQSVEPEAGDPQWGACPLLIADECPIYAVRPFGCRCLVSTHDCRRTGAAAMDPLVLTVNTLCLQVIEHVDRCGFSGNLIDVLCCLASDLGRGQYCRQELNPGPVPMVANRPLTKLMIPPEHRQATAALCQALLNIRVPQG